MVILPLLVSSPGHLPLLVSSQVILPLLVSSQVISPLLMSSPRSSPLCLRHLSCNSIFCFHLSLARRRWPSLGTQSLKHPFFFFHQSSPLFSFLHVENEKQTAWSSGVCVPALLSNLVPAITAENISCSCLREFFYIFVRRCTSMSVLCVSGMIFLFFLCFLIVFPPFSVFMRVLMDLNNAWFRYELVLMLGVDWS